MIVKSGLQTLFALALASSLTVYVSTKTLGQAGGRANGVELPVPQNEPVPEPKEYMWCTTDPRMDGIIIGDKPVSIPLKCCTNGQFIKDPSHPVDEHGDLKCSGDKSL
jgi:hypothetical protein